jgi:hypothetical protein
MHCAYYEPRQQAYDIRHVFVHSACLFLWSKKRRFVGNLEAQRMESKEGMDHFFCMRQKEFSS